MLATQTCARLGSAASQQCLRQLHQYLLNPLRPPVVRCSHIAARGAQSAAGPLDQQQQQMRDQPQQQPQHAEPAQQLDNSVQETLKLLEAGIGPLSTQPMVRSSGGCSRCHSLAAGHWQSQLGGSEVPLNSRKC